MNQEWEPWWNMPKSSAKKKKAGCGTREWWPGANSPSSQLNVVFSDNGGEEQRWSKLMYIPEGIIQERTGRCPLAALRTYERTTEEQHKAVSTILSSSSQSSYEQTIQNINQSKIDLNLKPNTSQVSTLHLQKWLHGCTLNTSSCCPWSWSNTNRHCPFTMWHSTI